MFRDFIHGFIEHGRCALKALALRSALRSTALCCQAHYITGARSKLAQNRHKPTHLCRPRGPSRRLNAPPREPTCAQVLANAIGLVRLLVAARPPASTAGLELLLLQRRQLGVNASEQPLRQDQARPA